MPVNKNTKSKWQDASSVVNQTRTDMANLLKSFSDAERETQNYKDLVNDILKNACRAIRDVSPQYVGNCDEDHKIEDKVNWKSKKLWILLLASPVVVELVKYIPNLIKLIQGS